jgi:hypothetical protein
MFPPVDENGDLDAQRGKRRGNERGRVGEKRDSKANSSDEAEGLRNVLESGE